MVEQSAADQWMVHRQFGGRAAGCSQVEDKDKEKSKAKMRQKQMQADEMDPIAALWDKIRRANSRQEKGENDI